MALRITVPKLGGILPARQKWCRLVQTRRWRAAPTMLAQAFTGTLLSYQGHNRERGSKARLIDSVNWAIPNLRLALLLASFSDCQHRNFALAKVNWKDVKKYSL